MFLKIKWIFLFIKIQSSILIDDVALQNIL